MELCPAPACSACLDGSSTNVCPAKTRVARSGPSPWSRVALAEMTAAKGKGTSPISRLAEAVLFATQPADCNPFGSRSLPDQDISNAAIADLSLRSMTGSPGARSEEHTSELQSLMRISYAV